VTKTLTVFECYVLWGSKHIKCETSGQMLDWTGSPNWSCSNVMTDFRLTVHSEATDICGTVVE